MRVSIGFSTSDWWVSRAIRWATRARVSHAFLLLEGVSPLGDLVLEAEWSGLRLSTLAKAAQGGTRVVETVVPAVDLAPAVLKALSWIGEEYNYTGLLGMFWVCLGRYFGKAWRNPLRNSRSMFCSEAVVYVLQEARYPGADALDPQSVDPQALADFLAVAQAVRH
jgi:hypothetical protein